MTRPHHVSPINAERSACAPYNFVRLPQQIVPATELHREGVTPWAAHDRYLPGLHTGYIDVDITTLTPLFIGPPEFRTGGTWDLPHRSEAIQSFRLTPSGLPVIPGSTINGLLENHIRILGFSRPNLFADRDPRIWMRQPVKLNANRQETARQRNERLAMNRRYDRYVTLRASTNNAGRVSATAGFLRIVNTDDGRKYYIVPLDTDHRGPCGNRTRFSIPFPAHAPYKVRNDVIANMPNANWRDPEDGSEYFPSENEPWFLIDVVFFTCDLLTEAGQKYHRFNVVTGIAPNDKTGRRSVQSLRQRAASFEDSRNQPNFLADRVPATSTICEVLRVDSIRTGVLVLTGKTGNGRSNAYVFPHPRNPDSWEENEKLKIPKDVFEAVDSDDQITQWQQRTFPGDESRIGVGRAAAGRLRDGDPVWYELDGGPDTAKTVTSFGRAGGYRVPYRHTLGQLIPTHLQRPAILNAGTCDITQALFGDVIGRTAIRRRVSAGHAVLMGDHDDPVDLEERPLAVTLLSPNRQSFSLYLTQKNPNDPGRLADFDSGTAEPRGFKLYLHRWTSAHKSTLFNPSAVNGQPNITQIIRPLRERLIFRTRIRFTNLSAPELGLLLRAILLANSPTTDPANPVSAHKLGRGRPLGLGSVHLRPQLHLLQPANRYTGTTSGFAEESDFTPYLNAYEHLVLRHARQTNEAISNEQSGWQQIDRLRELAHATYWQRRLPPEDTRPMSIEPINEFASDPVLPAILDLLWPRA